MARESTITYQQVAAAADKLTSQGGKATSRNVRAALGSGSNGTVCKHLLQWKNGQATPTQAIDAPLDPSIVRAINGQIATRVEEATTDATARLADMQAEMDDLIADNERKDSANERHAIELTALHGKYLALMGRTEQMESEAARTVAELAAERKKSEAARVELAKAQQRLEAVPNLETEIEKLRDGLSAAREEAASLRGQLAAVKNKPAVGTKTPAAKPKTVKTTRKA